MPTILETLRLLSDLGWRQVANHGRVRILMHPRRPGVKLVLRGTLTTTLPRAKLVEILEKAWLGEDPG